eukprot:Rmarinus@m.12664
MEDDPPLLQEDFLPHSEHITGDSKIVLDRLATSCDDDSMEMVVTDGTSWAEDSCCYLILRTGNAALAGFIPEHEYLWKREGFVHVDAETVIESDREDALTHITLEEDLDDGMSDSGGTVVACSMQNDDDDDIGFPSLDDVELSSDLHHIDGICNDDGPEDDSDSVVHAFAISREGSAEFVGEAEEPDASDSNLQNFDESDAAFAIDGPSGDFRLHSNQFPDTRGRISRDSSSVSEGADSGSGDGDEVCPNSTMADDAVAITVDTLADEIDACDQMVNSSVENENGGEGGHDASGGSDLGDNNKMNFRLVLTDLAEKESVGISSCADASPSKQVTERKKRRLSERLRRSLRLTPSKLPPAAIDAKYEIDRTEVLLQGWLSRRAVTLKVWKRHWFVLRPRVLDYYTDKSRRSKVGSIPLPLCTLTDVAHSKQREKDHCRFALTVFGGKFKTLRAVVKGDNKDPKGIRQALFKDRKLRMALGVRHLLEADTEEIKEAWINAIGSLNCLEPIVEGWLYKRGRRTRQWKKRWGTLQHNQILYRSSPGGCVRGVLVTSRSSLCPAAACAGKAAKHIGPGASCLAIQNSDTTKDFRTALRRSHRRRTVYLGFEDSSSCERWGDALVKYSTSMKDCRNKSSTRQTRTRLTRSSSGRFKAPFPFVFNYYPPVIVKSRHVINLEEETLDGRGADDDYYSPLLGKIRRRSSTKSSPGGGLYVADALARQGEAGDTDASDLDSESSTSGSEPEALSA